MKSKLSLVDAGLNGSAVFDLVNFNVLYNFFEHLLVIESVSTAYDASLGILSLGRS